MASTPTITHLGHACLLVQTATARLLIDPGTMSTFDDVRDLDAVLVTHQHPDHVDPARLARLLADNPAALLVLDVDSAPLADEALQGRKTERRVVSPGDHLDVAGCRVDVLGGRHAPVWRDVPGCTNAAYLLDDGALLHPGDSFHVPDQDVDVLAVAVDGPWLKLSEAVEYVDAVAPRVAVAVHEGETTDPDKYAGMLGAFASSPVRRLTAGEAYAP